MIHRRFALLVPVLGWLMCGASALAGGPATFNVRDFGAVGDGKTKDTVAIQKAMDECAVFGGGEVLFPAGNYLTGSIQIGKGTVLRLTKETTISGTPDIADYPVIDIRWEGRWEPGHRALIYAANVDHIGILGPGKIAGNPAVAKFNTMRGAVLIEPISCNDVHLEGFTTQYAGTWSNHPTFCTDVTIKGLTIHNTSDGMDIDSCKNVTIDSCDIDSGDDSISLKSGRGEDGARLGIACENVTITNCTLSDKHFACIGIGSETSGGVRNVKIQHCTFTHSRTYAIYIKTRIGRAGTIENISADDLDIQSGNKGFLRINLIGSGSASTVDDPVPGLLGYPTGKNFSFSNVKVDCAVLVDAYEISKEKPLQGLSLTNITGSCEKGMTLVNIDHAVLKDINVAIARGHLLATSNVNGTGLEGAVNYVPPKPTTKTTKPSKHKGSGTSAPSTEATTMPASE